MTGRGAGYCAGYANAAPGRGYGMGWGGGWGRGWRRGYVATGLPGWARFGWNAPWGAGPVAPPTPEQEAADLRAQAEWLQDQLDAIAQRIEELEQE